MKRDASQPTTCHLCDYIRGKKPHARDCPYRPGAPARPIVTAEAPATTRDTLIPIRMNADEIAILRAAAQRAGLGIGPWLRMLGLREAEAQTRAVKEKRRA